MIAPHLAERVAQRMIARLAPHCQAIAVAGSLRRQRMVNEEDTMETVYPATYTDSFGQEATTITNDGTTLRMRVRGVVFLGQGLDDWAAQLPAGSPQRAACRLGNDGTLGDCALTFTMPIGVMTMSGPATAPLLVMLVLRLLPPWQITERVGLVLRLGAAAYATQGDHGWMEDALDDLQARLPSGMHLCACHTCAFSGYPPGGNGAFGGLACFRTCKAAFRAVRTKADLVRALDRKAGWVQETFWCPEYERRDAPAVPRQGVS